MFSAVIIKSDMNDLEMRLIEHLLEETDYATGI